MEDPPPQGRRRPRTQRPLHVQLHRRVSRRIEAGERFILIVDAERDPDVGATRERLNVEIIADGESFRVGEINDIGNATRGPAWLREALISWLAQWRADVDDPRVGEPPIRAPPTGGV